MVIYSNLSGNRQLVELFVSFQRRFLGLPEELSVFKLEMKSALLICCRGKWYRYNPSNMPYLDIIKSVHGALFLQITFSDVDEDSGEVLASGVVNYFPFDLIETIEVE